MKRRIVFIISCCVFVLDKIESACLFCVGRRQSGVCVVLMYHDVPHDQRERFARQMDVALQVATPLPADSNASLEPGRKYFAVTFDDGLSSVAENAVPELESRRIPAAVFVVTGRFGEVPGWATDASGDGWAYTGRSGDRMLTPAQVRSLSGRVLIGSHSMTHPRFAELDEEQTRFELEASRRELSELLGADVDLFSFPYGTAPNEAVSRCRDAGYQRVFTNLPHCAFADPDEFVSGRVAVDPRDRPFEFHLKVSGAYRWLPSAFALKRRWRGVIRRAGPLAPARKEL